MNVVTRIFIKWQNRRVKSENWDGSVAINQGDILKLSGCKGTKIIDRRSWQSNLKRKEEAGIIIVAVAPEEAVITVTTEKETLSFTVKEVRQLKKLRKLSGAVTVQRPGFAPGRAWLTPTKVVVGKKAHLKIRYKLGQGGIASGGKIRILYPCKWIDWRLGRPEVLTSHNHSFLISKPRWTRLGEFEDKGTFSGEEMVIYELELLGPPIKKGETVEIHQRANKVQLLTNPDHPIRLSIDKTGDGPFLPLSKPLYLDVANEKAIKFRVDLPSLIKKGEEFKLTVKAMDKYNNIATNYAGEVFLSCPELLNLPRSIIFSSQDKGIRSIMGLSFSSEGIKRVSATDGKLKGKSNPTLVTSSQVKYKIYWGDLHAHTYMSDGYEGPDYCFRYARDVASLDFCSTADHVTHLSAQGWEQIQAVTERYNRPGRFVTFLGYEWGHGEQGDINVYFLKNHQPICRGSVMYHIGDWEFFQSLTRNSKPAKLWQVLQGKEVITIPHHLDLAMTGDLSLGYDVWAGPKIEPLAEIYSEWGCSEYAGCPKFPLEGDPWRKVLSTLFGHKYLFQDALARGYRFGVTAGSDDHLSMPGNLNTEASNNLPCRAGITAVYAKELSRKSIFAGLRARRTYATTGERIVLDFRINGHLMGEEIKGETNIKVRKIKVRAWGTERIKKIEVIKNNKVAYIYRGKGEKVEFVWTDRERLKRLTFYYIRLTQRDGNMAWSSPIWLEP